MADIVERLARMTRDGWRYYDQHEGDSVHCAIQDAGKEITTLRDRCAQLEKALEPFAREGDKWAKMWEDEHIPALHPKGNVCGSCGIEPDCDVAGFTIGDLRAARAALDQDKGATGE